MQTLKQSVSQVETPDVETSSADYARRFSGSVGQYFLDLQAREVLRLLSRWPDARVLEVGGGHGQLAIPLVRNGFDLTVTGSDQTCRERLDMLLEPGSFRYQSCNLVELPFDANAFDIVLAFRLLTHLNLWQKLVGEMCRVARKAIIVDYPDIRSFNLISNFLFGAKKAIEGNTRPYHCFRRKEILGAFSRGGFDRPLIRPQFFVPMVVHRRIGLAYVSQTVEAVASLTGLTRLFGSPIILCASAEATT